MSVAQAQEGIYVMEEADISDHAPFWDHSVLPVLVSSAPLQTALPLHLHCSVRRLSALAGAASCACTSRKALVFPLASLYEYDVAFQHA